MGKPVTKTTIWHVYIAECKNGEYYVGIATDVKARINLHNKGLACRYTRFRRPVKLLYTEVRPDYALARKREREIKGYSRSKKLDLIRSA